MEDMTKIDLYELLDVLQSSSTQEIKKAYRKKALKCHPDKNPDNPKAAELFHQLSRALEILTDVSARAAYDKVINAKKAAALRNKELDSKRKKLKEDLEARERQAEFNSSQEKSANDKLKAEIERLRKEGSKQLEEEVEFVRRQVQEEKFGYSAETDCSQFRLKISWKILDKETMGEVYNRSTLEKIFSKYGEIGALVVSSKKKCSALLEFTSSSAAIKAQQLEKGFPSNPLTVSWLSDPPPVVTRQEYIHGNVRDMGETHPAGKANIFPSMPTGNSAPLKRTAFPCFSPAPDVFAKNREEKQDEDFESLVLSRMRQAQQEKLRTEENKIEKEES